VCRQTLGDHVLRDLGANLSFSSATAKAELNGKPLQSFPDDAWPPFLRLWWLGPAWLLGIWAAQNQPSLQPWYWFALTACVTGAGASLVFHRSRAQPVCSISPRRRFLVDFWLRVLVLLTVMLLAWGWTMLRAQWRLDGGLEPALDNTYAHADFVITGIPVQHAHGVASSVNVTARVVASERIPLLDKVLIRWSGACVADCQTVVRPGQRWRGLLRWRNIHPPLNFFGADRQQQQLQQGILVSASVKGTAELLGEDDGQDWRIALQTMRHRMAMRMLSALDGKPWGPVMVALAIGDQHHLQAWHREVFAKTGVAHLVAISGTHVGLVASLVGGLAGFVARRFRLPDVRGVGGLTLVHFVPAQVVFAAAGSVAALLYCLLAGWGIPAQRAFYGWLIAATMLVWRKAAKWQEALALSAFLITAMDPWAALGPGLWLSFGAVTVLLVFARSLATGGLAGDKAVQADSSNRVAVFLRRCCKSLFAMLRLQLILTLATAPLGAHLFHSVSLVAIPANLWAAGWVSAMALPLTLLLGALSGIAVPDDWLYWPAVVAHGSVAFALWPVEWLAQLSWASLEVAQAPATVLFISLAGVALGLGVPYGLPRYLAWFLMLPQLFWKPQAPEHGGWRLTAFDFGQGSSVLIQTARHAVLYDTGWGNGQTDAVSLHILQQLQAMGVRRLDDVVISHPDLDHVGGLGTLERTRDIGRLWGSGLVGRDYVACRRGQKWSYDGVEFLMIGPLDGCASKALADKERNRCSCVLKVMGQWHSAILPGDIDTFTEKQLLAASRLEGGGEDHGNCIRRQKRSRNSRKQRGGKGHCATRLTHQKKNRKVDARGYRDNRTRQQATGTDGVRAGPSDVVMMAHHGSVSSSSRQWITAMGAKHAISQSGRFNRFGHPARSVEHAWQQQGARVWASARHGAVQVLSDSHGLQVQNARDKRRKYWHDLSPG